MEPTADSSATTSTLATKGKPAPRPAIRFTDVGQHFAPPSGSPFTALHSVDLTVADAEFCSIVGPSGCGKSTLLNMAAGLIRPTSGQVLVQDEQVTGVNTRIGYVSQDSNLFPWLTTRQNIELPLEIKGYSKADRRELGDEWLEMVGLDGFADSYPHQLSGGMQKRCSIARTLCYDPDVVLMDEPFGAVDAITRSVLQEVLLDLWSSKRKSVIFVTHDLNEAITLSDKVVVMTRRPGTVKAVVDIPLPRPRNVYEIAESPEFAEVHQELWRYFRTEIEMPGHRGSDPGTTGTATAGTANGHHSRKGAGHGSDE